MYTLFMILVFYCCVMWIAYGVELLDGWICVYKNVDGLTWQHGVALTALWPLAPVLGAISLARFLRRGVDEELR